MPVAFFDHSLTFNQDDQITLWVSLCQDAVSSIEVIKRDIENALHLPPHFLLQYFT